VIVFAPNQGLLLCGVLDLFSGGEPKGTLAREPSSECIAAMRTSLLASK
jgi:hypothetical protein